MPSDKKTKIKNLKPTMREKTRYLRYECFPAGSYDHKKVMGKVNELLGVFDGGDAGLSLIQHRKNRAVLRLRADKLDKVRTALMLISKIDNKEVMIHTTKVSGLVHKVKIS